MRSLAISRRAASTSQSIGTNGGRRERSSRQRVVAEESCRHRLELWNVRHDLQPIGAVAREHGVLRLERIRIVEAAHIYADDLGESFWCSEQQAPTVGTEVANSALPATTR